MRMWVFHPNTPINFFGRKISLDRKNHHFLINLNCYTVSNNRKKIENKFFISYMYVDQTILRKIIKYITQYVYNIFL